MAIQSKISPFTRQSTSAADGEPAAGSSPLRKKYKRPMSSSSDFESHYPSTICNLTPSQTARITQQFDQSLIARVVGKKIYPRQLAVRLRRNLHLVGNLDVLELGLGFFVLKFSCASDYCEALEERPWSIPHLCIYVFPWIPNFKPSEASIPFFDVWIRLPELSIEYYDREVLERIVETIGGRLVKIDQVTERREKCMYARICIRVNSCNPLDLSIQFGRNRQKILYEGLDSLCPDCRCVDDVKHDCSSNPSCFSGFDPHQNRARPFQATGSSLNSTSNSNSKKPLIPSERSPASAWGSRFRLLEEDPLLNLKLNEGPSPPISECERAGTGIRINSPEVPVKDKAVAKQEGKCGVSVSVQTLPNLPKESTALTIQATGSSMKKPLIPSESSVASARGSSFQMLENDRMPDLELNERPSLPIGKCEKAGTSININSPDGPVNKAVGEQKGKCGVSVSVQTLPNLPKESSTMTIKASELKHVAPSVVADQFKTTKSIKPTMVAVHNNEPQPSSLAVKSTAPLQPSPALEASLKFYSTVIQQSTIEKEMINTPSEGIRVDSWPTVYTISPTITSLAIELSKVPETTSRSSQNHYTIKFAPTSDQVDLEAASCSKKMLCWNFRGNDNAKLIQALKDLIRLHNPSIVLTFGTKISVADADRVVRELALDGSYCRKPDGYDGGVWLLLSQQDVQIEVSSNSPQQVSALVHFHSKTSEPVVGLSDADTETSMQHCVNTVFYSSTKLMDNTLAY